MNGWFLILIGVFLSLIGMLDINHSLIDHGLSYDYNLVMIHNGVLATILGGAIVTNNKK